MKIKRIRSIRRNSYSNKKYLFSIKYLFEIISFYFIYNQAIFATAPDIANTIHDASGIKFYEFPITLEKRC